MDYHLHSGSSPFPCIDDNFLYTQNKINPVRWLFKLLLLLSSCSFVPHRAILSLQRSLLIAISGLVIAKSVQYMIWFPSRLSLTGLQTQPGRQMVLQSSFFHQGIGDAGDSIGCSVLHIFPWYVIIPHLNVTCCTQFGQTLPVCRPASGVVTKGEQCRQPQQWLCFTTPTLNALHSIRIGVKQICTAVLGHKLHQKFRAAGIKCRSKRIGLILQCVYRLLNEGI